MMNKFQKILSLIVIILLCFVFIGGCEKEDPAEITLEFSKDYIVVENEVELPLDLGNISINEINFEIADPDIVGVLEYKVSALKAGSTSIIASYSSYMDELLVYVFPKIKKDYCLNDVITIDNASEFNIASSNDEILKYENNQLTAVGIGEAEIEINFKNNNDIFKKYQVKVQSSVELFEPQFEKEEYVVRPGEEFYLGLVNCDGKDFNWYVEDENILTVYDDFYAQPKKTGTTTVKITHKENPLVTKTIKVTVLPEAPEFLILEEKIVEGKKFEIAVLNDYSVNDVNVVYDQSAFEVSIQGEQIIVKPIKSGEYTISLQLKDYEIVVSEKTVKVYDKKPILNLSDTKMTIEDTLKLTVENYTKGFEVEIENGSLLSYQDGILEALAVGVTNVNVYVKEDKTLCTTIVVEVLPKMPNLAAVIQTIAVGEKTGLIIKNLDELCDTDINNYLFEIEENGVAKLEDNMIVALKEGTVNVKATLKSNPVVTGNTTVEVCKVDTQKYIHIEGVEAGVLEAGEMYDFGITGASDLSKYSWTTINDKVAIVNATGRVIAVNAGITVVNVYLKSNPSIKTTVTIKVEGVPNVDYIGRLIYIAELELGYREGSNNDTKYGDWYGLPNEAWCAMFVSWCANESGISTDIIPKYAGCTAGREWFMSRNQYGARGEYTPKAGDIIFFRNSDTTTGSSHTGIVINCDGKKVYTIEGNTSNMVAKRSYDLTNTSILGYGIPKYPAYDGEVSGGNTGGATDGSGETTT